MKTVRFSKVIEGAGKPETHLVLIEPAKDKELQAAVGAERVMTVFQGAVGNKTDRGEIGFESGRSRQFLVFPKSLKKFKGKTVVGIKYDLLHSPEVPKSERAAPVRPPKKKEAKRKAAALPARKPEPEKEVEKREKLKAPRRPAKVVSHKKAANIVEFPSQEDQDDEESEEVASLKKQVRRAMTSLEQGKQVAAFNQLKRIVDA